MSYEAPLLRHFTARFAELSSPTTIQPPDAEV
jgi:hypothetical protein